MRARTRETATCKERQSERATERKIASKLAREAGKTSKAISIQTNVGGGGEEKKDLEKGRGKRGKESENQLSISQLF